MPNLLPTPFVLHSHITQIIARFSGCPATWATHPHPLTPVEMMAVKKAVNLYLTQVASEYFNQQVEGKSSI